MNIFNVLLYVFTFSLFLYRNNLVESTGSRNFRGFSSGRPPDLKLVTSDGTKESEINSTGFEHRQLGLAGNVHEYNLNEGTRCVKVKQNDTEVWIETDTDTLSTFSSQSTFTDSVNVSEEQSSTSGQPSSVQSTSTETSTDQADGSGGSDPSQRKYPIKIVYNNRAKVMWIIFRDGYLGYMFINGKWIFKISRSISFDNHGTISSAILQSLNSLVTRDSTLLTPELQQSAILTNNLYPTDYSEGNAGYSHHQAGDSTPVDTYIDVPGFGTSSISVPKFFGQNSSISPVRSKPSLKKLPDTEEQPNIKFFTTDDSDPSSTVELSSDKYTVKYYENLKNDYLIELDTDAKCVLVKCEDKEVWKTGEHDLDEPTSSSYYKGYKHVVVRDEDKGVIYNEKKDTWNHYDTVYYRKDGKKKYVSKKPDQSKSKAPSQPESVPEQQPLTVPESQPTTLPEQPKEETKPVAEPVSGTPEAGQESSQTAGSPHLITVNIDLTESTDQVVYEHDTVNKAQRWTCKEGFLIEKVTKAGNVVWQPKDGRHGDRVVVREAEDGTKGKVYRPGETEGSSSTAQDQQHAKSQQPDASKTEEPTKKSEAAPTHTPTTPAQQSNPKLYTTDPNDNTKFVELATNAYSVTQNGDITTFTIGDSANCTKLTFENVLMWQYDSSKRGGLYPKTLDYNQSSNVLVLKFEGFEITFEKENGNWVYTEADTSKAAKQAQPAKESDATKTEQAKEAEESDATKTEQAKEAEDGTKTQAPEDQTATLTSGTTDTASVTLTSASQDQTATLTGGSDGSQQAQEAKQAKSEQVKEAEESDATKTEQAKEAEESDATKTEQAKEAEESDATKTEQAKEAEESDATKTEQAKEAEQQAKVYDTSEPAKEAQPAKESDATKTEQAKEAEESDATKTEQAKEAEESDATKTEQAKEAEDGTKTQAPEDQTATLTSGSDGSQQAGEATSTDQDTTPVLTSATQDQTSSVTLTSATDSQPTSVSVISEAKEELEQQTKESQQPDASKTEEPVKESEQQTKKSEQQADETKSEQPKESQQPDASKTEEPTKKSEAAPTHTPTTPAQQSNPKLYTTDPNDNTKFVELATNAYSVTQNGDITTFTIGDSANCTKLTFENVLMWQYDSSKRGGLYPKTLDYNQSSNVLVLKFEGFEITFEKENGNWVYTEADTSKAAKQAQPAKESDATKTEQAKEAEESDATKTEQAKEAEDGTKTQAPEDQTATLTSGTTDTASVTLTSASQDQTATLTGGSDGSQQAQEAKQAKSEQVKEAEESDATKTEQAKEAEQQAKVYDTSEPAKEAQPAKESDATKTEQAKEAEESDATKTEQAKEAEESDATKTEQAKEAEDGTKTQAPEDQTATLTSGSDGSQQAGEATSTDQDTTPVLTSATQDQTSSVTLTSATDSQPTSVSVISEAKEELEQQTKESQQPDASKTEEPVKESEQQTKKSEQQADETKSEQPKESQQPDASKTEEPTKKSEAAPTHTPTTPAQQSNPKLYTTDPNDNTKFVELATNAYSVTQNGDITTFTIGDSANCTKLTFENVLMWQYDSSKRGGLYPKTLDYNQSSNVLVLKFEGFEITFEKENGNWVYTEADTSKLAKQAQPAKKSEEPGKGDDTSELAKEAQEADETKSEQPKESGDKTATLTSGTTDTASVTLTSASQDQTATLTGGSDGSQQAQEAKQAKSEQVKEAEESDATKTEQAKEAEQQAKVYDTSEPAKEAQPAKESDATKTEQAKEAEESDATKTEQAKEAEESDATKTEQAKEAEESDATKTEQAKEAEQQAKVYDTSEPAKEAQPAKESDATKTEQAKEAEESDATKTEQAKEAEESDATKTEQAKEAEDGTKTQAPEDQTATLTGGSDGSQQARKAISDFSTTVISSGFFTSSSKSQEYYSQLPQNCLVLEEAIDNQHKFGINPFGVKPILVSTWS